MLQRLGGEQEARRAGAISPCGLAAEDGDHRFAEALQLALADSRDRLQRSERPRIRPGDGAERRIVEHDKWREAELLRFDSTPGAEALEAVVVILGVGRWVGGSW